MVGWVEYKWLKSCYIKNSQYWSVDTYSFETELFDDYSVVCLYLLSSFLLCNSEGDFSLIG